MASHKASKLFPAKVSGRAASQNLVWRHDSALFPTNFQRSHFFLRNSKADISIILVIKLKISVLTHHIRRQQISCDRLDTLCSIAYSNSDFKITKEVGGSHASLKTLKSLSRSRVRKHRNISVKRDKITHIYDCRMQK